MATKIFSLLVTIIPILLKIIYEILEKSKQNQEAKEKLLIFFRDVEKDLPIKLNDEHYRQISVLNERIKAEQVKK